MLRAGRPTVPASNTTNRPQGSPLAQATPQTGTQTGPHILTRNAPEPQPTATTPNAPARSAAPSAVSALSPEASRTKAVERSPSAPAKGESQANAGSVSAKSGTRSSTTALLSTKTAIMLQFDRYLNKFERASHSRLPIAVFHPLVFELLNLATGDLVQVSAADNAHPDKSAARLVWLCEAWPMQNVHPNAIRLKMPNTPAWQLVGPLTDQAINEKRQLPNEQKLRAPLQHSSLAHFAPILVEGTQVVVQRTLCPPVQARAITLVRIPASMQTKPPKSLTERKQAEALTAGRLIKANSNEADQQGSNAKVPEFFSEPQPSLNEGLQDEEDVILTQAAERHVLASLANTPLLIPSYISFNSSRHAIRFAVVAAEIGSTTEVICRDLFQRQHDLVMVSRNDPEVRSKAAITLSPTVASTHAMCNSSAMITFSSPTESTAFTIEPCSFQQPVPNLLGNGNLESGEALTLPTPQVPMYVTSLSHVKCVRTCATTMSTAIPPREPHHVCEVKTSNVDEPSSPESTTGSVTTTDNDAFELIGGLETQLSQIREAVELPLTKPELFRDRKIKPPRGVLLYGPPGTGKTLIARALASSTKASFIAISGAEISGRLVGEGERKMQQIFQMARQCAPCVLFIDEIDALCPARESIADEAQRRLVATMLTLMDGIGDAGQIVVLAATNRPQALDPALRRPGRFDREIEIGIPSRAARTDILTKLLRAHIRNSDETTSPHLDGITHQDLADVASVAHGYVGADLALVVREAAFARLHREFEQLPSDSDAKATSSKASLRITRDDLFIGLSRVRPSAMREVSADIPEVHWDDIGGQKDVKDRLREAFEWPLEHPEVFSHLGAPPPKGILLYGPPGCSKTLLAKALATECSRNFIAVKGPELFSKWVGDSEKAVREVFRKARAAAPSIIFFDEIDSIAMQRSGGDDGGSGSGDSVAERVLSQLLVELDGVEVLNDVTVLAATNRPDILDKALLRPGRIDRILYVKLPDAESAAEIFKIEMRRMSVDDTARSDEFLKRLGELAASKGMSGAEIAGCCREAALRQIRENVHSECVQAKYFEDALRDTVPRISKSMIEFYDRFQQVSGFTNC